MKRIVLAGLTAVMGLFLYACGGDEMAELSTKHTASYIGAGSYWQWDLTAEGTFTATMKATSASATASMVITGTYETFSTGFYKFTVGTATSPDGSVTSDLPTAGDSAYGFAVPNVILLVKPTGDNSEMLAMPVKTTTCPTTDIEFSWVRADGGASEGSNLETKDLWGNAKIPSAAGPLTGYKWILDGTVQSGDGSYPTHGGCSNGRYDFSGGGGGFINLTEGGVGIVNTETDDSDIVALPRDTSVTLETMRSKNFVALVFMQNGSNGEVKPLNITFPASGDGTYTMLENVETGEAGETGPITLSEAGTDQKAGFIKMLANAATDTNRPTMWAAVVSNIASTGRTMFFAAGANVPTAGGAANDAFAVIAIQK